MARQDGELEAFEEMLVEAFGNLLRLPDRERGFLLSGRRTWWPQIVRDRVTDYGDSEAAPRRQMSRREADLVRDLFEREGCLVEVVPVERRALVGLVLTMRVRRGGQWTWADVWRALGGRACGATSDGLRSRYETQLRRMMAAWERRQGLFRDWQQGGA